LYRAASHFWAIASGVSPYLSGDRTKHPSSIVVS
jgi:hypothetical protein